MYEIRFHDCMGGAECQKLCCTCCMRVSECQKLCCTSCMRVSECQKLCSTCCMRDSERQKLCCTSCMRVSERQKLCCTCCMRIFAPRKLWFNHNNGIPTKCKNPFSWLNENFRHRAPKHFHASVHKAGSLASAFDVVRPLSNGGGRANVYR